MLVFTATNNLVINPDKTAFITNKKKEQKMLVGKDTIKSEDSTVLLGMRVSGNLKWDSHVKEMKSKLRQRLGILRRLSYSLPDRALKQVAEGIFTSKLRYGIGLYCKPRLEKTDKSNRVLKDVTILQNDMLRVITHCKKRRDRSVAELRKKTGTLSVNQLCCYHILIEAYSILTNKSSEFIHNKWKGDPAKQVRAPRSEHLNKYIHTVKVPMKQTPNKNGFLYFGAELWNMLPPHLKKLQQDTQERPCEDTSLSDKEERIRRQQGMRKNAEKFKKSIKTWIMENIPADFSA